MSDIKKSKSRKKNLKIQHCKIKKKIKIHSSLCSETKLCKHILDTLKKQKLTQFIAFWNEIMLSKRNLFV